MSRHARTASRAAKAPDRAPDLAAAWPCLSAHGSTVRLEISALPNARRIGADRLHDGALRVRLGAPPTDGRANEQLLTWLAAELDLPRRATRLLRGACARRKTVEIDATPEHVGRWLALRLGAAAAVK